MEQIAGIAYMPTHHQIVCGKWGNGEMGGRQAHNDLAVVSQG